MTGTETCSYFAVSQSAMKQMSLECMHRWCVYGILNKGTADLNTCHYHSTVFSQQSLSHHCKRSNNSVAQQMAGAASCSRLTEMLPWALTVFTAPGLKKWTICCRKPNFTKQRRKSDVLILVCYEKFRTLNFAHVSSTSQMHNILPSWLS